MIHIYRVIEYPNKFLFAVNCSEDEKLEYFLPSDRNETNGFEQTHHRKVDKEYDTYACKLAHTLQQKLHIPPIHILMLQGKVVVNKSMRQSVLNDISQLIMQHLAELKPTMSDNTITTFSINTQMILGQGLVIRRGISACLEISPDNFPLIRFIVKIRFEDDKGNVIPNENNTIIDKMDKQQRKKYRAFMRLSTKDIFDFVKRFIDKLPQELFDKYQISRDFVDSRDIGFETWLWASDMPLWLELGKKQKFSLARSISEEAVNAGLYDIPQGNWAFFLIQPSPIFDSVTGMNEQVRIQIKQCAKKTIRDFMPDYQYQFDSLNYDAHTSIDTILQKISQKLKVTSVDIVVFMIVSSSKENQDISLFTGDLYKKLSEFDKSGYKTYRATINYTELIDEFNLPYIIENQILKSVTVLGAIPWRLVVKNYLPHGTCFIGIDVNIKKRPARVGGVIFDRHGVLCGYHVMKINQPHGDDISLEEIQIIVTKLIKYYSDTHDGQQPTHVVIHRDGVVRHKHELDVAKIIEQEGMKVDFIEIPKGEHETPKLYQYHNLDGTPSRDIAIGNEQTGEAYLITTFVIKESGKYPAPDPLRIRHQYGSTSLKILAGQVYALTQANYNNYHRTNRLPITIFYANALVNNLRMGDDDNEIGRKIRLGNKISWL